MSDIDEIIAGGGVVFKGGASEGSVGISVFNIEPSPVKSHSGEISLYTVIILPNTAPPISLFRDFPLKFS